MFELFHKTTEMGEMKSKLVLDAKNPNYYTNVGRKKKSEKFQHQG